MTRNISVTDLSERYDRTHPSSDRRQSVFWHNTWAMHYESWKTTMCGIAGYFHNEQRRTADADRLKRMTDTITHRGPDGEGLYISGGVALGHRRLSIIDIASGAQPMHKHENTITFN
ncbi:MAG: hypothetical protein JNL32_14220, partial [Candidatus Kapabacteria bacterium]|nr:hypothetical protein [Candidatus Kapabacteria bacterium]